MAADSSGLENNQAGKLNAGAAKKRPVHAFVAPKIIGGKNALSPVGELGMVEMTQALELIDVCYEQSGKLLQHGTLYRVNGRRQQVCDRQS
ncbi:riboflavin biosynthesis protein PYRR, chloroplastic-like [Solanum pennellii]|uniref:Riboflavin biosynthesis protein PYRR, chloroplastic-like n=1 Tax=Solanum pennellii TaxID=28526 RepID=A0ABM1UYB2_SOLPN|nr:riboflavin biosynthesis protein PYRR, chloroplastic-like [Solanum pennellii]